MIDPRRMAHVAALNIYPVKGCRGIALERARLLPTGFEHDREWLIVTAGRPLPHAARGAAAWR